MSLVKARTARTLVTTGLALAAAAAYVRLRARRAEREHPPSGRFVEVDGVRLHYVERGQGQPVLLLHGNVVTLDDYRLSGVLELAAERYRVIAFDRPGFGYSERPKGRRWTAAAQARLLHRALAQLGVESPVVVGHSWGTLVALALAQQEPRYVKSLVLLSGYYYPTLRPDVPLQSSLALPVVGTLMRHTVSPLLGRLLWSPSRKAMFSPAQPSPRFYDYPVWMSLRPSQLRASAEDAALMVPAASSLSAHYRELEMPVLVVAGDGDRIAWPDKHSRRLHQELPQSQLRLIPDAGHMVHYLAPREVMAAIDAAAGAQTTTAVPYREPPSYLEGTRPYAAAVSSPSTEERIR
jgi:pimeloyl-ACP methyl ester carboxylesterase